LDLGLQRDIEAIVRQETAKLKSANLRHAAVVVIDNPTGEILTMVGSADWDDPRGGQINGALSPRSPGSTLKPFTYLLAMARNQRTPASIIEDIPSPFRTPEGLNLPENYDRKYRGPVTLRSALACSLNVPAMRELNAMGGPAPLHELLTSLGLTTLGTDPDAYGLGLTIGNAPVSLLELTNAYATLARMGRHMPAVLFSSGKTPCPANISLPPEICYLIADILSDSKARAPAFPPGGLLDLPFRCAVKTGTSSDFRDNWCVGYTPGFTVGVWAGNYESQPMKGISGVAGAAPIFHRTMVRVHVGRPPVWPAPPAGIKTVTIDVRTGKSLSADAEHAHACRELVPETCVPAPASPADYDAGGKAWLAPIYTAWFQGSHNQRSNELALNPSPVLIEPLKILTPADGAVFLLDPEVPSGTGRLRPVTNLPGIARWESPTLHIEPGEPEPVIHLSPGIHTLTATDSRTGIARTLTLHVRSL
jgi:penicillin-binding protein 1C